MKIIGIILFILTFSFNSFAQNTYILKDSVCVSNECFELQELKINNQNLEIYKKIQRSYDIFNGVLFEIPEKRMQAKKDTLKKLLNENSLRESQFGFEKYKIFFSKNGLLNLSVDISSYGSPWQDTRYFLFDLNSNKDIGDQLFVYKSQLFKLFDKKI